MQRIHTLLIANRGEIALRVIRTCKELGIRTVAAYAEAEINAPYVKAADDAYALGPAGFMDGQRLLDIAAESGANAVHPGYGFLSENPAFARAVAQAGLVWIGPSADSIDALGDKIQARKIAEANDVSPIPGLSEALQTGAQLQDFAERQGLPIIIKKADGGGGRGITVCTTAEDVQAFIAAHDTAAGSDINQYFVERYVDTARHVETQCARDMHGNFHVVTTRDCSVQRRNQKLVEEAPAPFLPGDSGKTLRDWSERLFEAVDYVGLGTCEFLVDKDGSVYFLEVNPRLQVEHPVSEEVSGVDLVAEQLHIAQGEKLSPLPVARGHSIEFRITSEDPANNLTPSVGVLKELRWPGGPGVRIDTGIDQGDSVSPEFDSMIAKIIITAADRPAAIARSKRALAELHIVGIATPLPIFQALLENADFAGSAEGFNIATTWFERSFYQDGRLTSDEVPAQETQTPLSSDTPPVQGIERATYVIEVDGKRAELTLPVQLVAPTLAAAVTKRVQPLRRTGTRTGTAQPTSENEINPDGTIPSPIQGTVTRICVQDGQAVCAGELLVVLEAMKMEKYINAPVDGVIAEILVTAGGSINAQETIMRLEEKK
ncbi:MAG: biotin carboxylase N-terminal domain-containing protein [Actinomycetaceae bacterium]|nr:biotin carboxylase N-terminal domain-containing protein [Actinomycetaceae bacterium]